LAAFNKVYTIRSGKGLVQNIILTGSDKDIELCVEKETMFFAENGLMLNEKVCRDKNNTTSPQTYYFENDKDVIRQPGSLYFFKSCESKDCNKFDVTGLYKDPAFDFTEIVNMLGFEGLTNELLQNSDIGKKIEEILKTVSVEQFVNNTLIAHYENCDTDTYNPDIDFAWIDETKDIVTKEVEPITVTGTSETKHIKTEDVVTSETNATVTEDTKPKHGTAGAMLQGFRNRMTSKEPVNTKPVDTKPVEENKETESNEPPAPVLKEKKDANLIIKKHLTKEEDERNWELLNELRKQYEKTIEYITSTCNSQWTNIKNTMIDTLKTNQFKTQWCSMYMEISNDYSTELYERLYNLDIATNEFQKQVVHQVVKMGCAFCANEWEEDITFLAPGPHFVECPQCFMERGFEKHSPEETTDSEE